MYYKTKQQLIWTYLGKECWKLNAALNFSVVWRRSRERPCTYNMLPYVPYCSFTFCRFTRTTHRSQVRRLYSLYSTSRCTSCCWCWTPVCMHAVLSHVVQIYSSHVLPLCGLPFHHFLPFSIFVVLFRTKILRPVHIRNCSRGAMLYGKPCRNLARKMNKVRLNKLLLIQILYLRWPGLQNIGHCP